MPVTIRVHLSEKRSTHSQYENQTIGADIEAQGLELHTPEEIHRKTRELLQIARGAVQAQLLEPPPSETVNGHASTRYELQGHGKAAGKDHRETGSNGRDRGTDNGRDHDHGNGNGNGNGIGRRRGYGRPDPEPTAKQKQFLRQIARERDLDAETVGQICQRIIGVPLRACTKDDLSKLIDALLEEAA